MRYPYFHFFGSDFAIYNTLKLKKHPVDIFDLMNVMDFIDIINLIDIMVLIDIMDLIDR